MKGYEKLIYDMCRETQDSELMEIIKDLGNKIVYDIDHDSETTIDDINGFLFDGYIILEAINPRLVMEINFLSALILLLEEWVEDSEFVNRALGLPPDA